MRLSRVALAALVSTVAGDVLAQAHQGTVAISISVQSRDSARVEERYALAPSAAPIELRVLTQPCATIENLRLERVGVALAVVQSNEGPWITYRDTTASGTDALPLVVRYDVRLDGTGAIPLLHITTPLVRNDSARLGAVSVEVRFADIAGRVSFPHMTRQAPTQWSARYVGIPSFVEVAGIGVTGCDAIVGEGGDNGGLVWRFFLLVGIMVAWVPLYLSWARRTGESA